MWRQCDVAFLSTFILLLFLRIYQNLSTNFPSLFLLNITTQGVRHHSPLPPCHYHSSAGRVRGSSRGAQFIALYGQWSLAVSTPFPWLFRLSFLTYLLCTNLRLVLLLINSDQPCSVQALACTRNLQTEVGLPLIFFFFILFYILPSHVPHQYFCSVIYAIHSLL